ncbi:MAG: hypothetical protein K2N87_00245 [Eubacterium sp.]|nr:hypothetical protein [Eubacterium sp.]
MLKLVWGNYRCRFLVVWKAHNKMILWYIFWSYVYIMIVLRLDVIKYTMGMIPMLLGFWLSRMYPNELSKILFLCPMSEKERLKYLRTAYGLRVGIAVGVYFVLSLPAVVCGYLLCLQYIGISLLVISFVLGANMHHVFLSLFLVRQMGEKEFRLSLVYVVLSLFSHLCAWGTMIFYASFGINGSETHTDNIIFTVMVGIAFVINAAICMICYKPVIRNGINYESCWMIGSKEKGAGIERNAGA